MMSQLPNSLKEPLYTAQNYESEERERTLFQRLIKFKALPC